MSKSDNMSSAWGRFSSLYYSFAEVGFSLDLSRMKFDVSDLLGQQADFDRVFAAMQELEGGAIANPDENRMVGHYWLRAPELAVSSEIEEEIKVSWEKIRSFAERVHSGALVNPAGDKFSSILLIGIGGSALGPQFVSCALAEGSASLAINFLDNTDPDGMSLCLQKLGDLSGVLSIVISKSGSTKETRNGELVVKRAYQAAGLSYAKHMVAVTGAGSALDKRAESEGWLARFPMWDWVGGRTSELSAVGLLPAALQGVNIDEMLRGAREMDQQTREPQIESNPAALLALAWRAATKGRAAKSMVVLPYRDRLELLSRYLQQLVMESLGKEQDLNGTIVNQGLSVYGNKGSTDQHAYVQQLREGPNDFFVTFVNVLQDRGGVCIAGFDPSKLEVDPGITCGDYLSGFWQGTRQALWENKRESITIVLERVSVFSVGALIALFERAVGYYASLVGINAYHQPGVEAGKKAAESVLGVQRKVVAHFVSDSTPRGVCELAELLELCDAEEVIFHVLERLVANRRLSVQRSPKLGESKYGP